jgi:hypothetical protein
MSLHPVAIAPVMEDLEMKKLLDLNAFAAALALSVVPVLALAQTDPKMLTCTEFNSMTESNMLAAVVAMQLVSNDRSVNVTATAADSLDATKKACLANPKVNAIEAMAMK